MAEVWRLRLLKEETRKLKYLGADLALDKVILQNVVTKRPEAQPQHMLGRKSHRAAPHWVQRAYELRKFNPGSCITNTGPG